MIKKKAVKIKQKKQNVQILSDFGGYLDFWHRYLRSRVYTPFSYIERGKDVVVGELYNDRGQRSRPMLHLGVITTAFLVVVVAPLVFDQSAEREAGLSSNVLAASNDEVSFYTMQAEEVKALRGGEVTFHTVSEGETLDSIAQRYGLKKQTIMWENNLRENASVKEGDELRILPVDGIRHKVAKGETIETIGKKYGLEGAAVQAIVDFPFNDFVNDETFELAVGQYLMVPGGEKKTVAAPTATFARVMTPDAGTVSATGDFIWPAAGIITQGYSFYHKAIDIASGSGGPILAADSGVVTASGWDSSGYGNRVIVDHGNGSRTLYAHLRVLNVSEGQSVNRGDILGEMGSTGRSTGTHLHFEIRQDSVLLNPLDYLRM